MCHVRTILTWLVLMTSCGLKDSMFWVHFLTRAMGFLPPEWLRDPHPLSHQTHFEPFFKRKFVRAKCQTLTFIFYPYTNVTDILVSCVFPPHSMWSPKELNKICLCILWSMTTINLLQSDSTFRGIGLYLIACSIFGNEVTYSVNFISGLKVRTVILTKMYTH